MAEVTVNETDAPDGPADDGIFKVKDQYGRRILTVGALRQILDRHRDDTHVLIATDGWYVNIEAVAEPGDEWGTWSAVTFFPGADLDSRQF